MSAQPEDAPTTQQVVISTISGTAYAETDVTTLAALENVSDVQLADDGRSIALSVPVDAALARAAATAIARMHPNTPVRWAS